MSINVSGVGSSNHGMLMSAFPAAQRPFTEVNSLGKDFTIRPNSTIPDVIRACYPGVTPKAVSGHWSFLSRDNKERTYRPEIEDRFVFAGKSSLDVFRKEAHKLIAVLTDWFKSRGFPVTSDPDRKVEVPDKAAIWQMMNPKHSGHHELMRLYDDVQFGLSNIDIMLKACIVRTVNWGWWVVSYTGKDANDMEAFSDALWVFEQYVSKLTASSGFKNKIQLQWDGAGDPIDTNPGYPKFTGNVNSDGVPTSRLEIIKECEDLIGTIIRKHGSNYSWQNVLQEIDHRFGRYGLGGFPLCVAPIRRQQPGYKWAHQFRMTSSGLLTAYDERGYNSQRVAWMVPWIYNLLMTPFHTFIKAVRVEMPGMYHDGESRTLRLAMLKQQSAKGQCFMAEADYSNYDRFMPVNLVDRIVSIFCKHSPRPAYERDSSMFLHEGAALVWPDYSTTGDSGGWAFHPGKLGLLSGVKLTSETGSFVNFVINLQALMNAKKWSREQGLNYVSQYIDTTRHKVGSLPEFFYIQSDDSLLIASSPQDLFEMGEAFIAMIAKAGLRGEVMIGDRFLMRHLSGGKDLPVPARVWQNTLSNESAPPSMLIMEVGLAARTDGLFGYKTVDPFLTGKQNAICELSQRFTREVVLSLLRFIDNASVRSSGAVLCLKAILNKTNGILDEFRKKVTRELAEVELAANAKGRLMGMLYSLYKERHKPASALLLNEITMMSKEGSLLVDQMAAKEHAFFMYATSRMGIKPFVLA